MAKRKKKDSNSKKIFTIILSIIIVLLYYYYENDYSFAGLIDEFFPQTRQIEVNSDLNVFYLDVGQADSILITNNGHNMLIDAGNNEDGQKLVKYMKNELNINEFDYVVGTHPHEDHIGGLDDIINNFSVKNLLLPEAITTTRTFEEVLDAAERKSLEITVPEIGEEFTLGESIIKVIYTGTDTTDLNNTSIVLKLTFGNKSFLFTGDATSSTEKVILNSDIKANVLKVGHHGSAYSTTTEFLNRVNPEIAIISVAKENSYGHPAPSTMKKLKKVTNNIYTTSELGTILLTCDGDKIEMSNYKTDTNGG